MSAATGPTRAKKRRWRRRLNRAAWSKNELRGVYPMGWIEDADGALLLLDAWEIQDGDRVIRAPWHRVTP